MVDNLDKLNKEKEKLNKKKKDKLVQNVPIVLSKEDDSFAPQNDED